VFLLNCPKGPVVLRESYGFTGQRLRSIDAVLNGAMGTLCRAWEIIHGDR